jgi:hypothetical protein
MSRKSSYGQGHVVLCIWAFLVGFLFTLPGCEDEPVQRDYPRVKTLEVTNITSEGALFEAEVTETGSGMISEHGFVWSLNNPGLENDNKVFLGPLSGEGQFTAEIRSTLSEGNTYEVTAFVRSGEYTVYGNTVEFKSLGSLGPEITGFFPERALCGDTILIRGRNFSWVKASNVVRFNNATAIVCDQVADTVLKVVVPFTISATENIVSVEIAGNRSTYTQKSLTVDLPEIESFSPAEVHWGDTVEIFFRNLRNVDNLQFLIGNMHLLPIEPYDGNSVRIIVPPIADLDLASISFSAGGGTFSWDDPFTILPPSITRIYPATAFRPDTVTIYGFFSTDLQQTEVLFGTHPATVLSVTRDSLKVIVPGSLTESPVSITYRYRQFVFTTVPVFYLSPPEIASISPMSDYVGGVVTITGKNFINYYTTVKFNDIESQVISATDTRIQCYAPGNYSGEAVVSVTVCGSSTVYGEPFTLTNPEITSFYPSHGSPGDTLTIGGTNLNNVYRFLIAMDPDHPEQGGYDCDFVSGNSTTAKVIIPSREFTSGPVTAWAWRDWVESYLATEEIFQVDAPVINSFSPVSGRAGTEVTVTGLNFSKVNEYNVVRINGTEATVTSCSRNEIKFLMPAVPEGNYRISLSVCGHTVTSGNEFEYISPWKRLPDLPFQNNSFTMDFGDEVFVAAPVAGQVLTLYKFVPGTGTFVSAGQLNTSMYFFERPVVKGDKAYMLAFTYEASQFLIFDRNTKSFTAVTAPPGRLSTHISMMDGDSVLYAGGGLWKTYSGYYINEFWKYVPAAQTWTRLNDLPFNCMGSNFFTVDGRNFAISTDKKIWEYFPVSDTWSTVSVYPGPGAYNMMMVVCNGRVYLGHGAYGNNQIFSWDPALNSWDEIENELPYDRASPVDFEYEGKIYFGGGIDWRVDFWRYDPAKE